MESKIKKGQFKTEEEIKLMKISGKICSEIFKKVLENVKEGVSCSFLNKIAQEELQKKGAAASFMKVEGYKWAICTTVNDQVVHGIPNGRILKKGDILGIDFGVFYKGYHSDMAITVPVGEITKDIKIFLETGTNALKEAIKKAKVQSRIGDISATIQKEIETAGYSPVKSLTGHGIGRRLHEDPQIPGFGEFGTGPEILENMTLAIEVIYTQGSPEVKLEKDNWTIASADGSLGGLFEQTVAVTKNGPIVLTPYL